MVVLCFGCGVEFGVVRGGGDGGEDIIWSGEFAFQ